MNKNILRSIVIFLITGVVAYFIQSLVFIDLRFGLIEVYLFHAIASSVIYVSLEILSRTQKFQRQIGFLYLGTLFIKVAIFAGIFNGSIMSINDMTNKEALSLLFPLFIFLFLEVYFVAKILNKSG